MSKIFYRDLFESVPFSDAEIPSVSERVDTLSYQPVSRSVENFIASGRAVSSLRQIPLGESDAVSQSLDDAFNHEITYNQLQLS